jgi:hypothetical protein
MAELTYELILPRLNPWPKDPAFRNSVQERPYNHSSEEFSRILRSDDLLVLRLFCEEAVDTVLFFQGPHFPPTLQHTVGRCLPFYRRPWCIDKSTRTSTRAALPLAAADGLGPGPWFRLLVSGGQPPAEDACSQRLGCHCQQKHGDHRGPGADKAEGSRVYGGGQ